MRGVTTDAMPKESIRRAPEGLATPMHVSDFYVSGTVLDLFLPFASGLSSLTILAVAPDHQRPYSWFTKLLAPELPLLKCPQRRQQPLSFTFGSSAHG